MIIVRWDKVIRTDAQELSTNQVVPNNPDTSHYRESSIRIATFIQIIVSRNIVADTILTAVMSNEESYTIKNHMMRKNSLNC